MLTIIVLAVLLGAVILGDIIWLEFTELLWNLRQRLPGLNFDRRRRPKRRRWRFV